jgi:cell wall-associated NlpC family hydrolase
VSATGGVLGAIAFTTAISPASSAAEKVAAKSDASAETEAVSKVGTVSHSVAGSSARAADSLKTTALQYEVRQAEAKATVRAQEAAQKKADAAAKRKAEARDKAADARASRSTGRTALSAGSGNVSSVISFLKAQVGKPYVLGASGTASYDCSSLTQAAFKQVGVSLPRTSQPQSTTGTSVSLDSLQEGDLLYWGSAGSAYHVGVYVGGGKFIGAQNSSTGVVEKPLDYDPPSGAVRVL